MLHKNSIPFVSSYSLLSDTIAFRHISIMSIDAAADIINFNSTIPICSYGIITLMDQIIDSSENNTQGILLCL